MIDTQPVIVLVANLASSIYMTTHSSSVLCRSAASAGSQIERTCSRNMIRIVVMSALLMSPLPALAQSSGTSVGDRGETLLSFDLRNIIPTPRVRRPRRVPRTPSQRPPINRPVDGQTPIQAPANPFSRNRPVRQSAPAISPQEQEYLNSLAPDERQLYEIIQRAKRGTQQQQIANFIGSGFGITPTGTHQTAQDLDREFQNAIRDARSGSAASGKKPGNQLLQRILKKRSNETLEQWYARTSFLIYYTPREEYRLWRATLSAAESQAYDTFAQKRKVQQSQEVGEAWREMIRRDLTCRQVRNSDDEYVQVCDEYRFNQK